MIMSLQDMHDQFLHWFDKQSNNSAPEVTPEEIDIYLNNAQYQFIKVLVEQGLEKSQEWLDYTKNITNSYATTSFSPGNKPNGTNVLLPADYSLALLEEATIQYTDCGTTQTKRVPVIPVTRDEYNKVVTNPFKKPWKEEIIRLTSNGTSPNYYFQLIGFTGATVTNYYLDYLKEPARIQFGSMYSTTPPAPVDQVCELEPKAATKIVEIAVELAMKTMGDPRLQLEQLDKLVKQI